MNFTRVQGYRHYFGSFESFIGSKLVSAERTQYLYNGEPAGDDVGPLELQFEPASYLLLSPASDGETVTTSHNQLSVPDGFELDDCSRCDWLRIDCDDTFVGQQLIAVDAQIDRFGESEPYTSGWILRFEYGFLGYYNLGDDAYLFYDEQPPPCQGLSTRIERVAGSSVG